jgi:hypothetical protein
MVSHGPTLTAFTETQLADLLLVMIYSFSSGNMLGLSLHCL